MTREEEILDRCRRIETRLTKYMEWAGFDVQSKQARFENGVLYIPTMDLPLRQILNAIPEGCKHVVVMHRGKTVTTITI